MSTLIPLKQAAAMTALYRKEKENILDLTYRNKDILVICETFDRKDIDTILAAPDCTKFRIYFGMDDGLKVHAILVAANSNDEDILPNEENKSANPPGGGGIGEEGNRCPPICPPGSPLNGG